MLISPPESEVLDPAANRSFLHTSFVFKLPARSTFALIGKIPLLLSIMPEKLLVE
jgi:hypothetical protein